MIIINFKDADRLHTDACIDKCAPERGCVEDGIIS